MAKYWTSASQVPRVIKCAASAALPQTQSVSKYSDKGTDVHTAIEDAYKGGAEFVELEDARIPVRALNIPPGARLEVVYSWDVITDEVKEENVSSHRFYPEGRPYSTIFGTADMVALVDGSAVVRDWKSGSYVPSSDSWQLRLLAYTAARAFGVTSAITDIYSVRGGVVTPVPPRVWTKSELDETAVIVRRLYDRVNHLARKGVSVSDPVTGGHCHFCPALRSCPAMKAMLNSPPDREIDMSDLTQAYEKWSAIRSLEQWMAEAIKAAAAEEPIQTSDGGYFGRTRTGFRRFLK